MTWTPAERLIQLNLDYSRNPADTVTYFTARIGSPESSVLLDWAEARAVAGNQISLKLITFLFDVASGAQPPNEIFATYCSVGTALIEWPGGYGFEEFISEPMTALLQSGEESDAPAVYAEAIRKINEGAVRWFDQDFLGQFNEEFKSLALDFLLADDESDEVQTESRDRPGSLAQNVEGLEELLDDEGVEALRRERERDQGQQIQVEDPLQNAVIEGDVEHPDPQNAVLGNTGDLGDQLEALISEVAEVKEDPQELEELEEELEELRDPQNAVIEEQGQQPQNAIIDEEGQQPQNAVLGDDQPEGRPRAESEIDPQELEELLDDLNPQVQPEVVDQEKLDALEDLAQGGQQFVNDNFNSVNLKNLPEDKNGNNPEQIIVFEQYVLIGTNHAASYYNAANRLGVKGEIWISAKGGVFDPGTVKVRGIPPIQQGFVEAAIKGFSKKKVEFV